LSTTRLETFADGVFAIAATLLVLNVEVPELGDKSLAHELARLWPAYVGYAVSFLTIGIIWVNHHTVLRQLRGIDRTFLFINVFFLLCIAFIPFPTRLLATYVRTDDGEAAAFAYGLTLTATAIFFNLMWRYAIGGGGRLLRADADRREVDGITRSYRPGVPMYAGATVVGVFQAEVGAALFAAIALFYVLSSSVFGRDEGVVS
jgi:TMEM175 potassium channel family protein